MHTNTERVRKLPLSCHCGAEVTGRHRMDCGYYEPPKERKVMEASMRIDFPDKEANGSILSMIFSSIHEFDETIDALRNKLSPFIVERPETTKDPTEAKLPRNQLEQALIHLRGANNKLSRLISDIEV